MFHAREDLCVTAAVLDKQCLGFISDQKGEPTALYWHLSNCDECERLRERHEKPAQPGGRGVMARNSRPCETCGEEMLGLSVEYHTERTHNRKPTYAELLLETRETDPEPTPKTSDSLEKWAVAAAGALATVEDDAPEWAHLTEPLLARARALGVGGR